MTTLNLKIEELEKIQDQVMTLASKIDAITDQNRISKWFSNSETCDFLGVTARTLQNYRDNGILPYSKIGSKIYYKISDLEGLLNSHYYTAFDKGRRGE
ncbi:MAG: helix-turn-helix domain-containing protein [Bacteroidales bacterium]